MNYCKQEHISYRDGRPFRWFTDSGCPARAHKPQTVFAACCCAPFQSIEGAQSPCTKCGLGRETTCVSSAILIHSTI